MRGVRKAASFSRTPFILFLRQQCLVYLLLFIFWGPSVSSSSSSSSSSPQHRVNGSLPDGQHFDQEPTATPLIELSSTTEGDFNSSRPNSLTLDSGTPDSLLNSSVNSSAFGDQSVSNVTFTEALVTTERITPELNKTSPEVSLTRQRDLTSRSSTQEEATTEENTPDGSDSGPPDTSPAESNKSTNASREDYVASPSQGPVIVDTGDPAGDNMTVASNKTTTMAPDVYSPNTTLVLNASTSLDVGGLTTENTSSAYTDGDSVDKTDLPNTRQPEPSMNQSGSEAVLSTPTPSGDAVKDSPFGSVVILKNVSIEEVTSSRETEANANQSEEEVEDHPKNDVVQNGEPTLGAVGDLVESNVTTTAAPEVGVTNNPAIVELPVPEHLDNLGDFFGDLPPVGNGFSRKEKEVPPRNITGVGIKATVSVSMNVSARENAGSVHSHLETNRIAKGKAPESETASEDVRKDNSIVNGIQVPSNSVSDTFELSSPPTETTNRPQGEVAVTRKVNPLKPKFHFNFSAERVDTHRHPTSFSTDVIFPSTNESIKAPTLSGLTTDHAAEHPTSVPKVGNDSSSVAPQVVTAKKDSSTEDSSPLLVIEAEIKIKGQDFTPELGNRYSAGFKKLASSVQRMLTSLYSLTSLSTRIKKIKIDGFSSGSIVVDYILELTNYEDDETLDLDYLPHMFNSLLDKTHSFQGFTLDPSYTRFSEIKIRTPKPVIVSSPDPPIPQWAIAVIVIGSTSLIFIILFGAVTIYGRNHENRKYATKLREEDMERAIDVGNKGWDSKLSATYDNMAADDIFDVDHMADKKCPF